MADPSARELKLIQYLNEAYGKEKQLETTLQAQIGLAEKTLKKRFQDHLKETKAQARNLERRIKQLGGKAEATSLPGPDVVSDAASAATSVANKALAAAKGPVQALRGTGRADNLLRNVRDAFWNEAEEIAHYNVIESVANQLGDKDTAKLAKEHRRQEERMQSFLGKQIEQLVKAVIREEIPARERRPATASASRSRTSRSTSSSRTSSARTSSSRAKTRASAGSSSRAKSAGSKTRAKSTASKTRAKSAGSTSRAKSSGTTSRAKSSGASSRAKSSGAAKSSRSSRAKSSGTASRSTRAKSSGSSNGASSSRSGSTRSRAKSSSGRGSSS